MNKETKEISIWQRIIKHPECINKEQDLWIFYCSYCKRWYQGTRHGYFSLFIS